MDWGKMFGMLLSPFASLCSSLLSFVGCVLLVAGLVFLVAFVRVCKIRSLPLDPDKLREPYIKHKWLNLARWLLVDYLERGKHRGEFREFGFTFFVGRQGSGKTASMVHYLETIKERYPDCLIVTNFGYYRADRIMKSWRDLLTIRNGTKGVVFAIDEIHSEYSSAAWKDVPESLLSEISQQRKQRIKIVATSQLFTRVAKPLREQAATVVACRTIAGRWTRNKEYDAVDYTLLAEGTTKKVKPIGRSSFVQSDAFRACYDTYEKIERMSRADFIPRNERGRTE